MRAGGGDYGDLYTFMNTWNDFLNPLIYLNSPANQTLALGLASFSGQYGVSHVNQLMAASFVTMIPCLLLFAATPAVISWRILR